MITQRSKTIRAFLFLILFASLLAACSSDKTSFHIRGTLKNLEQAELLVLSPDGAIEGIDTIRVVQGKFRYSNHCQRPGTLLLVFPNASQQPIFVAGGKTLKLTADARNLKETRVTGSSDNELMNEFREATLYVQPQEEQKAAAAFIAEHPKSLTAQYLLRRFFLETAKPDYRKALTLIRQMLRQGADSLTLRQLKYDLQRIAAADNQQPLPAFSIQTVDGKTVTQAAFRQARTGIIVAFAPWNIASMSCNKALRQFRKQHRDSLPMLSICLDGNLVRCKQTIERDTLNWSVACPKELLSNPAIESLAIDAIPTYLIVEKGRIVKRGYDPKELESDLKKR